MNKRSNGKKNRRIVSGYRMSMFKPTFFFVAGEEEEEEEEEEERRRRRLEKYLQVKCNMIIAKSSNKKRICSSNPIL